MLLSTASPRDSVVKRRTNYSVRAKSYKWERFRIYLSNEAIMIAQTEKYRFFFSVTE